MLHWLHPRKLQKNLVEELLSLFVRIHVFFYTKDICQSKKAAKEKERSLQKEMRKATNSLDLGY